jgi:hypothetical protein
LGGVCTGVPVDCPGDICGGECNPADGACEFETVDTCSRTQGYWHRQCLGDGLITPGRGGGRGPTETLEPDWKNILDATDMFLSDNLAVMGGACQEGMVADPQNEVC